MFPFSMARSLSLGLAGGFASLLDDEFHDTLAAGAVNGTPAAPGPGTRTVVDTNGIMSTSGDVLVVNGTPAANDRYHLGSTTRALGKVHKITFPTMVTNVGAALRLGFVQNDTTGSAGEPGIAYASATSIALRDVGNTIYTFTIGAASHSYAFALRATGGLIFASISGQWILLLITPNGATNPVVPKVIMAAAAAVNFTVDNWRVSQSLYISSLWYDSFARANGALGSSESVGPDGQVTAVLPWTGATWTIVSNAAVNTPTPGTDVVVNGAFAADTDWSKGALWTISAGTAVATAASSDLTASVAPLTVGIWYQVTYDVPSVTAGTLALITGTNVSTTTSSSGSKTKVARAIATGALGFRAVGATLTLDNVVAKPLTLSELFSSINVATTADVHARVTITLDGSGATKPTGMVLNLDSAATPANFILAYLDGNGNAVLDECVAGVYTNKISAAVTYSAGAFLYVIRRGTSAWMFYNNAQVGAVQTMTANTNKLFGKFSTSPLCSISAIEIWPDGGGGEHAALGFI